MKITRTKGGILTHEVDVNNIQVPDMWHLAMRLEGPDRAMLLETWYLANDMLQALQEQAGL